MRLSSVLESSNSKSLNMHGVESGFSPCRSTHWDSVFGAGTVHILSTPVNFNNWQRYRLMGFQSSEVTDLCLYIYLYVSSTLVTSCEELAHWKRFWCWEGLGAGEGDDRGWDGWMASPTRWTWVWVNSGSWWWTGRPGVLRSWGDKESDNWATELNWTFSAMINW